MENDKEHFRHLLLYYFDAKKTTVEAHFRNLFWVCSIS